jgi:hypothetical protein
LFLVEVRAVHKLKLVQLVAHNFFARQFMRNEVPAICVSEVFTSVNTIALYSSARIDGILFVVQTVVFYIVARLFRRMLPLSWITISVCGGALPAGYVRKLTKR